MAIRLITGGPGSGKTYFMVAHLVDKYFDYKKATDDFQKKPEFKDLAIITNIDELALDHINLDDAIKKAGKTVETFFTREYQDTIHKKYGKIIYIIDESPMYFRSRFYNTGVFAYFEYHRHYGDDIYLIAIDRYKISKEISTMAETEFRAVRRSLSFAGELKYNEMMNGEIVSRKILKPKKEIHRLYKSFTHKETEKIKKTPILKIAAALIIIFPILAWYFINRIKPDNGKATAAVLEEKAPVKTETRRSERRNANESENLKIVLIESYAVVNDKLYFFIDPTTGLKTDPDLYNGKILQKGNKYYTFLDQEQYDKYIEKKLKSSWGNSPKETPYTTTD